MINFTTKHQILVLGILYLSLLHVPFSASVFANDNAFIRGDCNQDAIVNREDLQVLIDYLFFGANVQCEAALDINADQKINVEDPIALAHVLNTYYGKMPSPYPLCGAADYGTSLSCQSYSICRNTYPTNNLLPNYKLRSPSRLDDCVLTDLNQDGKLDIVAAGFNRSSLVTYINKGGSFEPGASLKFGATSGDHLAFRIGALKSKDMNGDGLPDIITCCPINGILSVFHTTINLEYSTPFTFELSPGLSDVEIADFNSDGINDIAVSNAYQNTVSILLADSFIGYTLLTSLATADRPESIASADINSDGRIDILSANRYSDTISVFTANAAGGYDNSDRLDTRNDPRCIQLEDLNGDSLKDIVVLCNSPIRASILYGNPNGVFSPPIDIPMPNATKFLLVEDFNLDGDLDLISGTGHYPIGEDSHTLSISYGDGSGTFSPRTEWASHWPTEHLSVGDLNGDGYNDFCKATGGYSLSLEFGNNQNQLNQELHVQWPENHRPVLIEDLDANGSLDIVSIDNITDDLVFSEFDGIGSFNQYNTIQFVDPIRSIILKDMNSDGTIDLVFTNEGIDQIALRYGLSGGGYAPAIYTHGPGINEYSIDSNTPIADFNNDGYMDFVKISGNSHNTRLETFLGDAVGSFSLSNSQFIAGVVGISLLIRQLNTADINLDGNPDILLRQEYPGTILSYIGKGDGRFHNEPGIIQAYKVTQSLVTDFNNDGLPDIAFMTTDSDQQQYLQLTTNSGNEHFELAQSSPVLESYFLLPPADLDNDGHIDLIFDGNSTYTVLHGDSSGHFLRHSTHSLARDNSSPRFHDVDGDGDLDCLCVYYEFIIGGPVYEIRINFNKSIP